MSPVWRKRASGSNIGTYPWRGRFISSFCLSESPVFALSGPRFTAIHPPSTKNNPPFRADHPPDSYGEASERRKKVPETGEDSSISSTPECQNFSRYPVSRLPEPEPCRIGLRATAGARFRTAGMKRLQIFSSKERLPSLFAFFHADSQCGAKRSGKGQEATKADSPAPVTTVLAPCLNCLSPCFHPTILLQAFFRYSKGDKP